MPSYKTNDPRGWCGDPKRGAAMGRYSRMDEGPEYEGKFTLRRVRLDNGGYDSLGTYWGHGEPLYWVANEEGSIDYNIRASSRDAAKAEVRFSYPKARFYN